MTHERLKPESDSAQIIRGIFETHMSMGNMLGLPSNLKDFRHPDNPLRYVGVPVWVSSMWYGFLLSRRTTFVYRHPDFEGDYIHASQFIDQGVHVHERSAKCEADSVRVSASDLLEMIVNYTDAGFEAPDGWRLRCMAVLNPIQKRDAKKKK